MIQIDTGYACAGIILNDNICIEAAPIFNWMVGKHIHTIRKWKRIVRITPLMAEFANE